MDSGRPQFDPGTLAPESLIKEQDKAAALKTRLGRIRREFEEKETEKLAEKYRLPYIDLFAFPINIDALKIVPENISRERGIIVFAKTGLEARVGVIDPSNPTTKEYLKFLEKEEGYHLVVYLVSESSLEDALKLHKKFIIGETPPIGVEIETEEISYFEKELAEIIELKKAIREIPTTKIIDTLFAGAIKTDASDLHLEPEKDEFRVRYRIDGVLHTITQLPLEAYSRILSRLKVLADVTINIKDRPQDGRFSIKTEKEGDMQIRVSFLPGAFGESVVMRILNRQAKALDLEVLGIDGAALKRIKTELMKPNGMILTTGPTGSGKTTTLYTFLKMLNEEGVKIITIEDPIEYQLEGVAQTQVNRESGYDFANGLRSIVRQDPDIIMVGEIRDEETAEIAVHSALTGHLVFSTLHTNDAIGVVPRLMDLGIKPELIPPSINAMIAQRLVRRLCENCKEKYEVVGETLESIRKILAMISPKAEIQIPKDIKYLYKPKGCPVCHGIGYKGRIGIYEIITINRDIEKLILERASETKIQDAALESGMITMLQDGIVKALKGVTDLQEVYRTTGTGEYIKELYEKVMTEQLKRGVTIQKENKEKIKKETNSISEAAELIKKSTVENMISNTVGAALLMRAGDIHFEPRENVVKIRFRIDGLLHDIADIDKEIYPPVLAQVKLFSGIKTDIHEAVIDSRFTIHLEGKDMDARVSIVAGGWGETIVIRILSDEAKSLTLENLGFSDRDMKQIEVAIKKPNGMVLTTGPTGSGKTTTLYSMLNKLNSPETKIITVEDPIEYRLEGVLQTQIDTEKGYTFDNALRALLRQNPNIMMIGEIRDNETARIAVEAAFTGHLMLATLHTNSAIGILPRLVNLGITPPDIIASLSLGMAQRLVRRICEKCKEEYKPKKEEEMIIKKVLEEIPKKAGVQIPAPIKLYRGKGCVECSGLGFKGRIVIAEMFNMNKEIQETIARTALPAELQKAAVESGMITMVQDGVLKALSGFTTLEEVQRLTEL